MSQSIIKEIEALRGMTVGQLQVEWERLYGEPTHSRNRDYLLRRLCWRTQELRYGGLPAEANERILALTPATFVRSQLPRGVHPTTASISTPPGVSRRRDPRLPRPGSVIVREYRGQQLRLLLLDDGFELDGVHYDSLTEAARAATGSHWNGRLFWGLAKRQRGR